MKITKKLTALLLTLAMVLSFIPANTARADDMVYFINFDNATVDTSGANAVITFNDTNVTATVSGVAEGFSQWNDGKELRIAKNHETDITFTLDSNFDAETMEVSVNGPNQYHGNLQVEGNIAMFTGLILPDGGLNLNVTNKQNNGGGGGENPQPVGNKKAKINLSGPEGSWQVAPMVREEYDIVTDEYSSMEYSKYAYVVDVSINGGQRTEAVSQYSKGMDLSRYASQEITYNREDSEDKVDIKFFSNWGNRIESVTINGTPYDIPLNYDDRNAWLNAFGEQGIGFVIEDVPVSTNTDTDGNEIYNIEVKVRPITEEECYIGNFLWSNDDRMDPEIAGNYNDMYIGHSNLELLSITYDDGTGEHTVDYEDLLDENGNETLPFIHQSTNVGFETGIEMSEMVVPEGSWVTMKIETKYGYQVKSFECNGSDIRLGDTSVFSFRIGKGNFHIGAHVEKQEDEAKVKADVISDATVELAEGTLDTGSARLEVSDADINEAKATAFSDEASEAGYDIESYLDINLNQVFYKGTGNSDDVWANPMEDLDKAATITLTLEDGVGSEDVVLIHNIHDGEEFEVIEVDSYNPETNEITFKADSFSNFAIAKKEEKKEDKKEEKKEETKVEGTKFSTYEGNTFYKDDKGDVRAYDKDGKLIRDEFKCDGTYTYYLQFDGTAMKDRLTYHPDGEHIIYLDSEGHEVFSDFAHVKKSIAGEEVDDFCFFDVFGYMYVDKITWDKTGTVLYYANPYGVMEVGKWFQFSDTVTWGDGTECEGIAGGYGYASEDATLMRDQWTYDWEGRFCYMQGNGVALY